jgi:hypothetical protein
VTVSLAIPMRRPLSKQSCHLRKGLHYLRDACQCWHDVADNVRYSVRLGRTNADISIAMRWAAFITPSVVLELALKAYWV